MQDSNLAIRLLEGLSAMTGRGMWVFKLSVPLLFFLFLVLSLRRYRNSSSVTLEGVPLRTVAWAIGVVLVAAAIRFSMEIEFLFPAIVRMKATFFKWTAMECLVSSIFGWALGARILLLGGAEGPGTRETAASGAWRKEVALSLVIMAVAFGFEAWKLSPVYHLCREEVDSNGITIQTHDATCGPAALSTLFRLHGLNFTEREIARRGQTRSNGTTGGELADVVRSMGYDCWYGPCSLDYILLCNRPCIIGVDDDHWIVIMTRNQKLGKLVAGNPSFGLDLYDPKRLAREWRGKALFLGKGYTGSVNQSADSSKMPSLRAALDRVGIMGIDEKASLNSFRTRYGIAESESVGMAELMALAPLDRDWAPKLFDTKGL